MPDAARVLDPTNHPGVVSGPGLPNVLIGGQPAAVIGDSHTCGMPPAPTGAGPHPPTVIVKGSTSVLIGGRGAARKGDTAGCGAAILGGLPTVQIGG
jgi:uncharacterized Zn-binding protein involved in type VI secretion